VAACYALSCRHLRKYGLLLLKGPEWQNWRSAPRRTASRRNDLRKSTQRLTAAWCAKSLPGADVRPLWGRSDEPCLACRAVPNWCVALSIESAFSFQFAKRCFPPLPGRECRRSDRHACTTLRSVTTRPQRQHDSYTPPYCAATHGCGLPLHDRRVSSALSRRAQGICAS
jgi:hypothetical protein